MKFRAGGATNSSAAYSYGESRYVYSTNVLAAYTQDVNTTGGIRFGETLSGEAGRYNLEIFSPQSSKKKFFNWASSNRIHGFYGTGFVDLTTSFDGIIIIPTSGTITGTVYVYGYSK
jgi:hypothetical protein